jgi:hypothetical protein
MPIRQETFQMQPLDYIQYVKDLNVKYTEEIQEKLDPIYNFVNENDCCVTLTGSDGKSERHPQSNHEIEFLVHEGVDRVKFIGDIFDRYKQSSMGDFPAEFRGYEKDPTVRVIGVDTLSYAYNNRDAVYPDRILNSKKILGSDQTYVEARNQLLHEFSLTSEDSKRIHDRVKSQLYDYKKSLKTGVYRDIVVFDVNAGLQIYDESNGGLCFGFKIPVLRTVQRKLDSLTIKYIRDNESRIDLNDLCGTLATELPSNTCDRFDMFAIYLGIDPKTVESWKYAYAWSQREYHKIQEKYKSKRTTVRTKFDKDEFENSRKIIGNFLETSF